ncbi:hypothetical protein [Aquimarina longa]|uniref:hypothetical protein n=1 Tax=Aquimarina longa TaxID=1080221 RepID=UPI000780ED4C|nr:hypothetical protein [Aquimarina longa]
MIQLGAVEFVSQEAHEKFLQNNIKTFDELENFPSIVTANKANNYYTYFYYIKEENGRNKYLIDSIFMR